MTVRASRSLALGTAVALLAWPAPADPPAPEAASPTQVVEALHACILGAMRDSETLGFEGRYERFDPVLTELFDLRFMAEKSVGRHWKTANAADQQRLVDTFSRYTVANYAGRFDGWSGQKFETLGEKASARGTVLVRSRLLDPEGDDVGLDYRLKIWEGSWRIIDIYFNGTVSELALRRSEYSSLIKREGFEALLVALDERIDELGESPADQET